METVRILWSGLTGNTGKAAIGQSANVPGVEIAAGLSRWPQSSGCFKVDKEQIGKDGSKMYCGTWSEYHKWYRYSDIPSLNAARPNKGEFDIIVDFSYPDVFEEVLALAVRTNVPIIIGTSGLSDRQMAMLYDATNKIPVFRSGNFRFKVKKFIDELVKLSQQHDGLILTEKFYAKKHLPSETSKVIRRRIREATGKYVEVFSSAPYPPGSGINEWIFDADDANNDAPLARCRVVGYRELAEDILRIAKVMANKPVKKGEFYDLDELWDELVSWALS